MDKLRIYNLALDVYNMPHLTEEQLEDKEAWSAHPEIQTLEITYPVALRKAMRERAWSFLDTELELGEDKGPKFGYAHSYALPNGLFRLTRADGTYEQMGNMLLTNGAPVAFGQMSEVPDTGVPEDFEHLVAYALAYFAGSRLSSGDQKKNVAAEFYRTLLDSMIASDVADSRRINRRIENGYGSYI